MDESPRNPDEPREPPSYDAEKEGYTGISAGTLSDAGAVGDARAFAEMIVDTIREGLLVLDFDLRVRAANESFYRLFDVRPEETVGRLVYELGDGQWDLPELRVLLEEILPHQKVMDDFEVDHDFERVGRRNVLLNARRLNDHHLILLAIEDVTERKRAERAVRARDERLRRMMNAEGVGILTFAEDGTLIDANDAFLAMHGYTHEEVESGTMTWRDLTPPGYVAESERQMERLAATGRVGPYEKEYLRKDGSRSWMLFAGAALGDGTIVEYCVDVSGRKRAEEAARESEERYRLLVESAREYAILMLDAEGRITTWSAGAERVFGYTEAEALGQPGAMIFTEEDRAAGVPARELKAAAETGRASDDRWHVRKGGTRFWANGVTEALHDEAGHVRGFTKVLRDNTARKRSEDALRESRERLQLALRAADAGAWEYDVARAVQVMSPEMFALFGVPPTPDGEVPTIWPETVPAEEQARLTPLVEKLFARRSPEWELEFRVAHPERGERWFTTRGRVAYGEDGRPRRVVGIAVDITERKRAEEALRGANETLEARVRERTAQVRALALRLTAAEQAERHRLAEILHDDLQQRLFGLSVLLNLLPDAGSDAERRELHARAAQTLASATALTRSLSTELSPPVLASDRLAELLAWLAEQKRARFGLSVEVAVEEPCVVPGLETRALLYRVLQEALFNVAKHAGTDRARLSARCERSEVVVEVEDEGVGFDPAATAERAGGSAPLTASGAGGFGLTNVRERLRLAGGRLDVASAPGRGTRVTVIVPVHGENP